MDTVNAVIYARYSDDEQRGESIDGQIRDCSRFASQNNMVVVGSYIDRAITGRTDKRPQFQRMIRDAARGQFSVVLVWKIDRFARSRYDIAIYKGRLKSAGVKVESVMERVPEGPEGIILESVMEGYAEYYSVDLAQKVRRGFYDSALQRKTLGHIPLGYRSGAGGRYEIVPEQAAVVRRIFEEYVSGVPSKKIFEGLNRDGYRTAKGNPFTKTAMRQILSNELYTGMYRYQDIEDPNGAPAIISREIFEKAKERLSLYARKPALKKLDGGFLLTGKAFCGVCGEALAGDGGTSRTGVVYRYYSCVGHKRHVCDFPSIRKEVLEDAVVRRLSEVVCDDAVIDAFADRFMVWQAGNVQNDPREALKKQRAECRRKLDNALAAIMDGLNSPALKEKVSALEDEIREIDLRIAETVPEPVLDRDSVGWFLRSFRDGDLDDAGFRIQLVDLFLQRVIVYPDGRLLLRLNFCGDAAEQGGDVPDWETVMREGEVIGESGSDLGAAGEPNSANLNHTEIIFWNGLLLALSAFHRQ